MRTPALDRAWQLARADWRATLVLVVVAAVAEFSALGALLSGAALADLFVTRGVLEIEALDEPRIRELLGREADEHVGTRLRYEDTGLLPLVWRTTDSAQLGTVGGIVGSMPALMRNLPAFVTVMTVGTVLAIAYFAFSYLLQVASLAAALQAGTRLREAIREHALDLGDCDGLLGGDRSLEQLFHNDGDVIIQALARRWESRVRLATIAPLLALVLLVAALVTNLVGLIVLVLIALTAFSAGALSWLMLSMLERRVFAERDVSHRERGTRQLAAVLDVLRRTRLLRGFRLGELPGETFARRLGSYHRDVAAREASHLKARLLQTTLVLLGTALLVFLLGMNRLREPPAISIAAVVVLAGVLAGAARHWLLFGGRPGELRRANRAADRIFAYLDRTDAVREATDASPIKRITRHVKLQNVRVIDGGGAPLADGLNLNIQAGSRVALLATDPQLAAAVVDLLPRFHDPASGIVSMDGRDIRGMELATLRKQVGLVLAREMVFTGTVLDNITCGDTKYGVVQATEAARKAQAYSFIQRLPDGFETLLGERGVQLEAWEAFRIALARAILRKPSLLVVEEPDEPIDAATSELLDHCLQLLVAKRTSIFLPTRQSMLRDADRVFLLHQARLHDQGTHAELLHRCELYRQVLYLRFNV